MILDPNAMLYRTFKTLILFGISCSILAQAPQAMSYQAVMRDGNGVLLTNTDLGMRISVVQGNENGPVVYAETHATVTNTNGLVSLVIGEGQVEAGSFEAVDWSAGPYLLRTETDPEGGSNYSIEGYSPLLSVPYALHAANSDPGPPGPPGPQGMAGMDGCATDQRDSLIVLYNQSFAHGYHQDADGVGQWLVQQIGGTTHQAVASKRAVVLFNNGMAYAFHLDNSGNGHWSTQPLGNTGHTAVVTDRTIVLYNNATAYAFHVDGSGAGTWTLQALGNTNHSNKAHGDKIVVWNNATAWGFAVDEQGNGAWTSQSIGGTTHSVITTR